MPSTSICCARLIPDALLHCEEKRGADNGGVFGWTVMTALNGAKLVTLATIALCVLQHGGLHNMRQVCSQIRPRLC